MSNYQLTEQDLVHKNERRYFILALIISLAIYIGLLFSITGLFFLIFFMLISFFSHALALGHIRTNGVRLSPQQFPQVYEKVEELCEKMSIPIVPDVYVMESSGILNAFATRFFRRNMILVYSAIFELIEHDLDDELNFIIAHELAHIKRKHITKQILILPSLWIPGFSQAYSRACEYTSDLLAAYYTAKPEAAKNSLLIFAVGKALHKHVNPVDYFNQIIEERGFFAWLSEKLSSHPPLPKRIDEITSFYAGTQSASTNTSLKKLLIFGLTVVLLLVGMAGVIKNALDQLDVEALLNELVMMEDTPLLIAAVVEEDLTAVSLLLNDGADINIQDRYGWSALQWAVMDDNMPITLALLEAGADPNIGDYLSEVPLMRAASNGNMELIRVLLNAGAEINHQDYDGWTPLMYAIYSGDPEVLKLLLDSGANKELKDYSNHTSLMIAIKQGHKDMASLLRK